MASFVLDFIDCKRRQGCKIFHFYCDNCSGQNKNRMIFAMLMHAAVKFQVKIVLRFLLTGHTQNEGDTAHGAIETASPPLELFEPEDWWTLISTCRKENVVIQEHPSPLL